MESHRVNSIISGRKPVPCVLTYIEANSNTPMLRFTSLYVSACDYPSCNVNIPPSCWIVNIKFTKMCRHLLSRLLFRRSFHPSRTKEKIIPSFTHEISHYLHFIYQPSYQSSDGKGTSLFSYSTFQNITTDVCVMTFHRLFYAAT